MKWPAKVFYGWWILAISVTVNVIKHGTFDRGFTIYFLPIQATLGISRATYAFAELLARLLGAIQGPVVGYLIDRLGPRTMMVVGGLISGLGFILLSRTHSYLYFLVIYVGLLSFGSRLGYDNVSPTAINYWFRRRRGLAMEFLFVGNDIGGMAVTPLLVLIVHSHSEGWRTSAVVSGIVILAVVVPLSLLVRRSPESMGLLPDGDRADAPRSQPDAGQSRGEGADLGGADLGTVGAPASQPPSDMDFTPKEAMKTPSFWQLTVTLALRSAVLSGVQFHLVPLMVWARGPGSERTAGLLVGLLAFSGLVGKPLAGWMGDKWSKQRISAAAMLAGVLAMVVLLISGGHLWQLAVFVILLGLSQSANPLSYAILGDFFGRKSFPILSGWQHLPSHLMAMGIPLLVGLAFDRTGSYKWALIPVAIVYGLSALSYWTLPRPKPLVRSSAPYFPSRDQGS